MDEYLNALSALIEKKDAAIAQIEAWAAKGNLNVKEKSDLIDGAQEAFTREKSLLLAPLSAASGQSSSTQAASAVQIAIHVPPSTPSAPSTNSVNPGQFQLSAPNTTPNAHTLVDTGATNAGSTSSAASARADNPIPAVAAPAARARTVINLVSPAPSTSSSTSSTANPSLSVKRTRYARDHFDPSDIQSIREENGYNISDKRRTESATTTRPEIEAYNVLRSQYGWKKEWGFGDFRHTIVVVNPLGRPHKKKDGPVLGEDFFVDVQQALAFAQRQARENE